jgi:hypothetical protein
MTIMAAVRDFVGRIANQRRLSKFIGPIYVTLPTYLGADGDRQGSGRSLAVNIFGVSVLTSEANQRGRQETPI